MSKLEVDVANLFWKTKQTTRSLVETPFKTESDFERMIFQTPEILGDIFLLKRQVRGGNKPGIPDIVGVDNDGNVCIIEMKNTTVDASIIPQVLQYAIWAETNPDSIKNLWLECTDKPDELEISWDAFQVRIVVLAPQILRSTLDVVNKINYPVDLVEAKRWVEGDNELVLINKLEPDKSVRPRPVKGMEEYDEAFYKRERNPKSAEQFFRYVKEVESLVAREGWALETKFNKGYCAFKSGFFIAFGVEWMGSKTFAFFVKLSESEATEVPIPMTKYSSQWKQAYYYVEPGKTKTEDFAPLFHKAYKRLAGD